MNYLTNMTDDELERTLVQMPGDFAVIREAARRFVPGGREALARTAELEARCTKLQDAVDLYETDLHARVEAAELEVVRLTEANAMLNDLVEALSVQSRQIDDAAVDLALDAVLRASGSALGNFTLQLTIDRMRDAMRAAMAGA